MKKRICFAGFGDGELEALQPSLAALGGAWDCVFAPDAASTLDALAAAPFDAAVANLTLHGISDSELLQQAAVQHPRTLRFVLGDVGDRELIVNCMGAAHQFISRPWKPPELISIIERSLALDAWLSSDKLREFVPRLGKLPSLPATYFEILKKAESPNSSIESIGEVIARDPALTARLLQMVNSPACGLDNKITDPTEAVSRLGLNTVKSLVLCLQLFTESSPADGASLSMDELWQHSFAVAKLSNKIVLHCIASERMASEAYTAGLLHNIGQIVLATNLSREYSAIVETARKRKCRLPEVELEQLGVTSNQVGAYLLGLWGMPLPLVEAAALHHTPASATPVEFTLLTVVHVANVLANEDDGSISGLPLPKLDTEYLATLDLPQKTGAWKKLLASNPQNGHEKENHAASNTTSSTRQQPKRGFPIKKILAFAAIAALIVAGVVFVPKALHVTDAGASGIAAAPPSATTGTDGTPTPAATATVSGFDSIKIQSILFSTSHAVVLINGKTLEVGEDIDGIRVVSIEPTTVVLTYKGEQKTFTLPKQ